LVEWRRGSLARSGTGRAILRFAVLDQRRRIETNGLFLYSFKL